MKILLYDYPKSSASWRVRIALRLKKISYESMQIDLASSKQLEPEFRAINPNESVPVIVFEDDEESKKSIVLTQSLAIIEFLNEVFANHGVDLMKDNMLHTAQVREIAQLIACDIHAVQNLRVCKAASELGNIERPEWAARFIERGFVALERHLQHTAGDFCVGNSVSMADICLVPQVYNAYRWKVSLEDFPIIRRITKSCLAMKEFQEDFVGPLTAALA